MDKHIVGTWDSPQGKITGLFVWTWAPSITKYFPLWGFFQKAEDSYQIKTEFGVESLFKEFSAVEKSLHFWDLKTFQTQLEKGFHGKG